MPPPHGGRTAWIIGVVAGAVVLTLVAVAGVVLAVRASGPDGDPRAGDRQAVPARTPAVAPSEAPASTPPATGDEPPAADTTYAYVADICETVDYSLALDLVAATAGPEEWDDFSYEDSLGSFARCNIDLDDGTSYGFLHANVYTADDPAKADSDYRVIMAEGEEVQVPDRVEEVDGPWQEGELWLGDTTMDTAATIFALDGNMFVDISFFLQDSVPTDEQMGDAIGPIAEQLFEVSAG
jgi:hypothetical protein